MSANVTLCQPLSLDFKNRANIIIIRKYEACAEAWAFLIWR